MSKTEEDWAEDDQVAPEDEVVRNLVVLLLDTSGTMSSAGPDGRTQLEELSDAVTQFLHVGIKQAGSLIRNGELAVATFHHGRVDWLVLDPEAESERPFHFVGYCDASPQLKAGGRTPLYRALDEAMDVIAARKASLARSGIQLLFRPNLYVITDGRNNDPDGPSAESVLTRLRREEDQRRFLLWILPTSEADFDSLSAMSNGHNLVRHVSDMHMADILDWVSRSMDAAGADDDSNPTHQAGIREML